MNHNEALSILNSSNDINIYNWTWGTIIRNRNSKTFPKRTQKNSTQIPKSTYNINDYTRTWGTIVTPHPTWSTYSGPSTNYAITHGTMAEALKLEEYNQEPIDQHSLSTLKSKY